MSTSQMTVIAALLLGFILGVLATSARHRSTMSAEASSPIAIQLDEMRRSLDAMQRSAQDAVEKRVRSEAELTGVITEMRNESKSYLAETRKFTSALTNSQARGKFGEAQLELLLEQAGLRKGIEYIAQRSTSDTTGIPDITVKMPGGAQIYIDSKFPFERFLDAFDTEDSDDRDNYLALHSRDLFDHVKALAKRGYHTSQNSPDFVILFLPFESLLAEALRTDSTLLERSFNQGVTIATPTSMMALLRTVGHIYTHNRAVESAEEITEIAGKFLNNLALLHSKIVALGKAISGTAKAYEELIPTAEKTVLSPAREIQALGVAGDREKLAIEYPDAPIEIRELKEQE